ncbi:MAG: nuclear transport factor 2 family protein [Bacteroidetes bacterium]|nr:nuclear transport factor 2 family protein [Bacteroidota bacterium]
MRYIVTISLLFIYSTLFAQSEKALSIAADGFNNALIERDSNALKTLLHEKLVYGHSNGWKQTKKEVIDDLFNGKIAYHKISQSEESIVMDGNTATVRSIADIDVTMEGKDLHFKLHVLQVWIWKNKKWQLFGRQSAKI